LNLARSIYITENCDILFDNVRIIHPSGEGGRIFYIDPGSSTKFTLKNSLIYHLASFHLIGYKIGSGDLKLYLSNNTFYMSNSNTPNGFFVNYGGTVYGEWKDNIFYTGNLLLINGDDRIISFTNLICDYNIFRGINLNGMHTEALGSHNIKLPDSFTYSPAINSLSMVEPLSV